MPLKYIGAKMVAVRAWMSGMHLLGVSPSLHPFAHLRQSVDFVSLTPLQAYETLQVPLERKLLAQCKHILLGGGAISPALEQMLFGLPCAVWSSYGMTETYSHIALRRINGASASPYYHALSGVQLSIHDTGALVIHDTCTDVGPLITNDVVKLIENDLFLPIGRLDNVVNCGGIKHTLDQLEHLLSDFPHPFFLAKRRDKKFGEIIIMIYQAEHEYDDIKAYCAARLHKHAVPKDFIRVDHLPLSENDKPQRWKFY
jgi:O-succinylbenzoic acid--CoA ligase